VSDRTATLGRALVLLNDEETSRGFLQDLLTPAERETIPNRLEVFRMLIEVKLTGRKKTHAQIAKELDVAVGVVDRAANALRSSDGSIEKVCAQLIAT